jgi:hypothetical protein
LAFPLGDIPCSYRRLAERPDRYRSSRSP